MNIFEQADTAYLILLKINYYTSDKWKPDNYTAELAITLKF